MKYELVGFFKHEIFRNDENEYTVGKVKVLRSSIEPKMLKKMTEASYITIVGYLPKLLKDESYTFYGEVTDNQYGLQFKVDTYEMEQKNDKTSLIDFLASDLFKGVGKVLAKRIVDKLGIDAVDKIIKDKECLNDIEGISENTADALFEGLLVNYESEKIIRFLHDNGFGPRLSKKIFRLYKQNTVALLRENPYRLIDDIENIGFKRADHFAAEMNYDLKSPNRIKASIKHTFLEMCFREGYTYITEDQLLRSSYSFLNQQDLNLSKDDILLNIEQLIEEQHIIKDENRFYLKSLYQAETTIANTIYRLSLNHKEDQPIDLDKLNQMISDMEGKTTFTYTIKQKEAIKHALKNKITVITGGPGTGKTTVVNGVIKTYKKLHDIKEKDLNDVLALVAPTGRAAKRMQETTGCPAMTIHRLLGYGLTGEMTYNEHSPIPHKLLICDESSMIDVTLASYLLSAVKDDIQIVFVGDVNQLPSVGPGEVLKSIIDSTHVETIVLDKIHRQKNNSTIIDLAHDINHQVISKDLLKKQKDRNFIWSKNDKILENLQFIIENAVKKDFSIENIQLLAPMYKGAIGIDAINNHIQNTVNKKTEEKKEISIYNKTFRHGDKVIQLVNRPTDHVMNGDIGFISHIFTETNDENVRLIVQFDDIEVSYTDQELEQLTLAYCISIHKSQGSEFDIVILVLSKSYTIMLRKKLIYTAVTRAKKYLILVGDPEAFKIAVQNTREVIRQTTLGLRIQQLFQKNNIVFDTFEFKINVNENITPYDFL